MSRAPRHRLRAMIAMVIVSGCAEAERRTLVLPEVEGARSAILGVAQGPTLQVHARDLTQGGWPILISDEPEGDVPDRTSVSVRLYDVSLEALELSSGPVLPGEGLPLPTQGKLADYERLLELGVDSDWRADQLGEAHREFRSPSFIEPDSCSTPVSLGSVELETASTVVGSARLGSDAVILQASGALSLVNEMGATSVYDRWPQLQEMLGPQLTAIHTWGEDLILASCTGTTASFVRLGSTAGPTLISAEGMPTCPTRLSSYEGQLQALIGNREVFVFDLATETWRELGRFARATYPTRFIAVGVDRAMGFSTSAPDPMTLQRTHQALSLGPEGATIAVIPLVDDRDHEISTPVLVGDQVVVAWTDIVTAVKFVVGPFGGPFHVRKERDVRAVLALAVHEGGVATGGRRGQFQEVRISDPERAAPCEVLAAVPIPQVTEIVALGDGRFALAGESNFELPDQTRRQLISFNGLR